MTPVENRGDHPLNLGVFLKAPLPLPQPRLNLRYFWMNVWTRGLERRNAIDGQLQMPPTVPRAHLNRGCHCGACSLNLATSRGADEGRRCNAAKDQWGRDTCVRVTKPTNQIWGRVVLPQIVKITEERERERDKLKECVKNKVQTLLFCLYKGTSLFSPQKHFSWKKTIKEIRTKKIALWRPCSTTGLTEV